jgi:predicted permease
MSEIRLACRLLWKARAVASVSVLTLGLGIGASTAIYSVVHGVLFRPLPFPDPDRIVRIWQVGERGGRSNFSDPNFDDLRDRTRSLAALAQYSALTVSVAGGSSPVRTGAAAVSADFFRALGVQPAIGRLFADRDQHRGAAPTVVVTHAFWRDQLGSRRDLGSAVLRFDDRSYDVVGVLPETARFPADTDLFTPRGLEERLPSRTAHNWRVIARLAPGATLAQAQAEISAIARGMKREHGAHTWMADAMLLPLRESLVGSVRPLLLILLGAVGLLLLVACGNVGNLMLARAATRQREMAIRAALGAARLRIFVPLLAEAALLALAGGLLGLLLARVALAAVLAIAPGGLPRAEEIALDLPVLALGIFLTGLTAIALATTAGWRLLRGDPADALRSGSRSETGGTSAVRTRRLLVVAQLALSLVLLTSAGLLARSFVRLLQQDIGFRAEGLLTIAIATTGHDGEAGRARLAALHDRLIAALAALPGAAGAAGTNVFPMAGEGANGTFLVLEGPPPADFETFGRLALDPVRTGNALYRAVTADYFRVLGIPLVDGRLFRDGEDAEAPHAALISRSLAAQRWPGENPIGRRLAFGNMDGDMRPLTIVGIVGDVRERGFEAAPQPVIYVNARQRPAATGAFTLVVRTLGPPEALVDPARAALARIVPEVPPRMRTGRQVLDGAVADRRLALSLIGGFALAALALAVVGLYGITAYMVTQRVQEIGVRMALGAQPSAVRRLVLGQGLMLVAIGGAVGLLAAVLAARLLRALLFEITPADPVTHAAVAIVLGASALVACLVPAQRATRIDPLIALRQP